MTQLILASQSASRRAMLKAAGIDFDAMAPMVDEESAKAALRAEGLTARDLADALAELKALKLSRRHPAALVLGADQTLCLDDGTMFDKAGSRAGLKEQLCQLSGKTHSLWTAVVVAKGGDAIWRHVERCRMTMRPLSAEFIEDYVDGEGENLLECVGGYRIEGRGIQLFSKIEASHFAILGLPLLPLLDMLRTHQLVKS